MTTTDRQTAILKSLIISKFRELKGQAAQYEAQRYNPESYQYSGITQAERAQRAASEAEAAKHFTIEEIKKTSYYSLCLLSVARGLYLQAQDFSKNPHIKIPNLKMVLILRHWHDLKYPEAKIYSTKYLINIK